MVSEGDLLASALLAVRSTPRGLIALGGRARREGLVASRSVIGNPGRIVASAVVVTTAIVVVVPAVIASVHGMVGGSVNDLRNDS